MRKFFGRKPAVHNLRTARTMMAMHQHLAALGVPPSASNPYYVAVEKIVSGDWGMLGNDSAGDCVEAQEGHTLMLRTANAGTIVIPTAQQVIALYSAETGYDPRQQQSDGTNPTDGGTDETSDAQYMISTGFLGHKADATAMLDPTNVDHIKWAIQLFGAVELGVNWTQQAMDQFNAGQPITDFSGTSIGGHSVPIVHYEGDTPYIVTWAERVPTTWDWVKSAADEAHGLIFADWICAQGTAPSGFDLTTLVGDLSAISGTAVQIPRHVSPSLTPSAPDP